MSLEQAPEIVKHQPATRDAFLGGRLIVSQPAKGFRAGLDSVLLGAAVGLGRGPMLDLGAGVGTASLVAMAYDQELTATLAELDPDMCALAALNLAENSFADRARVLALDITGAGRDRVAAGLPEAHFAAVIANPPFFGTGQGTAPAASRATARHMEPNSLDQWGRAAAQHAARGGVAIFIYPAAGLHGLLQALDGRFGALEVLPLSPRQNEPATRILVRGRRDSRAPLKLLASRALHEKDERGFRPEFEAIFRGETRLDW